LINSAFTWRSLKGRCHGKDFAVVTNLRPKIGVVFGGRIFIVALPFQNRLDYRNSDGQIERALSEATFYSTLVRFGAVTPGICLLIFVPCEKNGKIWHIWSIISFLDLS